MVKIQKYLDKDENTRYKFRYYAGVDELTGKQRYIRRQGFTSEEDAKNELLKIKYLVSTNQYFKDVKSGKFGDVLDEWLTLHKTRVKASTYHIIETRVTKYVRPYFNDMYVDKITVRHCQDFVSKAFVTTPKGYVYLISIVKNTLDYALRLGMIESNPMLYVIKPKKQATISDKHDNFYNKDELKSSLRLLSITTKKNILYSAYLPILVSVSASVWL
ncbi:Arm DNA-binding domain-containing protein [Ligilactobacillus salivarius]